MYQNLMLAVCCMMQKVVCHSPNSKLAVLGLLCSPATQCMSRQQHAVMCPCERTMQTRAFTAYLLFSCRCCWTLKASTHTTRQVQWPASVA